MDATLLVPGDRVMSHCRYGYTCHHPVLLLRLYLPSSGTTFVPDKSDEVDVFLSSLSTLDAGSFHCFLMSTVVANRVEMNSFVNFALAIISQFHYKREASIRESAIRRTYLHLLLTLQDGDV